MLLQNCSKTRSEQTKEHTGPRPLVLLQPKHEFAFQARSADTKQPPKPLQRWRPNTLRRAQSFQAERALPPHRRDPEPAREGRAGSVIITAFKTEKYDVLFSEAAEPAPARGPCPRAAASPLRWRESEASGGKRPEANPAPAATVSRPPTTAPRPRGARPRSPAEKKRGKRRPHRAGASARPERRPPPATDPLPPSAAAKAELSLP